MGMITEYPFIDTAQALRYYHNNHPARARYKNLLEETHGDKPACEQFSGAHPADIWAGVIGAVTDALFCFDRERRKIFAWTHLAPREMQLHPLEVASKSGISSRTVYRWQREVMEELARCLRFRQLIPPESDKY